MGSRSRLCVIAATWVDHALVDASIQFHRVVLASIPLCSSLWFAVRLRASCAISMTLGIDNPCPNNAWFLIKSLKKLGFQNKIYVKVRLNLKILNISGLPTVRLWSSKKSFIIRDRQRKLVAFDCRICGRCMIL